MNLTPKKLRAWIDSLGVEHQEIAQAFGISKANLSHILAGRQKLTDFRAQAFACYLTLIEVREQQLETIAVKIARHTNTVLKKRLQYVVVYYDDRTGIRVNFKIAKWFDDEDDAIQFIQDKDPMMILRYEDHKVYDHWSGEEI